MSRSLHKLNALQVSRLTKMGRHSDGGGLYLSIGHGGRRRWIFLYRDRRTKKLREMGLGSTEAVPLAKARERARQAREALAEGVDPIDSARAERTGIPTFGALAEEVISALEGGWANPRHRLQWRTTLAVPIPAISISCSDASRSSVPGERDQWRVGCVTAPLG